MNLCSIKVGSGLGVWFAAGATGIGLAAAAAAGAPLFGNPQWRCMSDARAVACGDLDNDGDVDLVVANFSDQSVSIFLTSEACELLEQSAILLGYNVDCVVIGDVDGVNGPDIVTAHSADDQIGVLLNDGSGSFTDPASFYGASNACRLALVDLDADDDLDIVAANRDASSLHTLDNLGGGAFDVATDTPAGGSQRGVAAGDLDGDTWPDVIVCNISNYRIEVLLNDQAGNVSQFSDLYLDSRPLAVATGDFDGDNIPDAAIACGGSGNEVVIALNDGAGNFTAHEQSPGVNSIAVGGEPAWIAAGDLDGDSDLDLVTANTDTSLVSILINDGSAHYTVMSELNTTNQPDCVQLADMDGDDDLDIVLAHDAGASVSVILDVVPYGFTTFALTDTANSAAGPVLVDVGEDSRGDLDAIVGSRSAQTPEFRVHLGDGAGGFGEPIVYSLDAAVRALAGGDLDDDAKADLALCLNSNEVAVFQNDSSGNFIEAWRSAPLDQVPMVIRIGDLDGDTAPDLAIVYNGVLGVFYNQGSCQFGGFQSFSSGSSTQDIALGDIDVDDDLDVLAASADSGFFRNDGSGGFTEYKPLGIDADLAAIWNGFRSVLVSIPSSDMIWVKRNVVDGDEVFYAYHHAAGPAPTGAIAASLQGTIGEDILVADETAGSVFVYRYSVGPGGEVLTGPTPYAVGPNPQGVAAGDMNGDGFLDMVTQNGTRDQLSVTLQVPPPCVGDLDGDGKTDVFDFSRFSLFFGFGPGATPDMGDLNHDGYINIFDFAIFVTNFGCGTHG